jgi:hypothetical protein
MLALFLLWLLTGVSAFSLGTALHWLAGASSFPDRPFDRFLSRTLLGLFSLASLVLLLSLTGPVRVSASSLAILVGPIAVLLGGSLRNDARLSLPLRGEAVSLAAAAVATAAACSGIIMVHDTGLYHYPLMRWLQEFGTNAGMASFHHRFGFSSSWLALSALLDSGPLRGRGATALSGLLMALLVTHFAVVLHRVFVRTASAADYFAAGAYPFLFLFGMTQRFHVSPSPNFPAAAGVVVGCWLLLQPGGARPPARAAILLFAGAVFAVKVSTAPLIAVAALAVLTCRPDRWAIAVLPVGGLLAATIVAANVRSTGCPLYPASYLCSESPAAVGAAKADEIEYETRNWARYLGRMPSNAEVWAADWLPRWVGYYQHSIAAAVVAVSLFGCLLLRVWRWPLLVGLMGIAYVLWGAPDLRFGYGFAALLPGLVAMEAFAARAAIPLPRLTLALWTVLAAAILLSDMLYHEHAYRKWLGRPEARWSASRLLLPQPVPKPAAYTASSNGIRHWMPLVSDGCWAIDFPCTPYPLRPEVVLCDSERGLAGGLCRSGAH